MRKLSEERSPLHPTRRMVMGGAAFLAAPFLIGAGGALAAEPVEVEIANGRLRGTRDAGAVSFKGIPYAADTGGANRFKAPQPVAHWAGVRDATQFGDRCPQARGPQGAAPGGPAYSENCCVLNVYTPEIGANARRPVMVYLHGGGFASGSGDGPTLDGANLARFGDVVVVTLNHRLNLFGFTPLGFLGEEFRDAGNAGQLDLIAALNWVKTNIGAFGGDPAQVSVFGQSGGGSKIEVLLVMPNARGLFRGTMNMSGSSAYAMEPAADKEPLSLEFLKVLGVDKADARKLQGFSPDQLLAAFRTAVANLKTDGNQRPVIDGRHIQHSPLSPEGLAMQASVPQIISSTATEATAFLFNDKRNLDVTAEGLKTRIAAQFHLDDARTAAVIAAYKQADPSRTPRDILVAVGSDALVRRPQLEAAERKAAAGNRRVYVSEFVWKTPVDGGIWGAPHAIDIPFAFGTLDKNRMTTDAGPGAKEVSRNLMSAFVAFARKADPNNARMPAWQPYDGARRRTMVVDATCRVVEDFQGADRRASLMLPNQDAFVLVDGPLFHAPA